jgi:PadR family transcriptional regulator PadR
LAVAFFVTPYYNDYIAIMYCKVVIFLFRCLVLQDSNLAIFFCITTLHYKVGGNVSIRSQLLKGILEGCILAVIRRQSVYGYELAVKLQEHGLEVSEGSIYPILLRLQKEKLIKGTMKKSPTGPNRKYYVLTEDGMAALEQFKQNWEQLKTPVDGLLERVEKL